MTSFESIKMIDQIDKDIVNGYLKILHQLIQSDDNYKIPSLITYWCLLFYDSPEQFAGYRDKYAAITDNGTTAKNISEINYYATVYGKNQLYE